MKVLFTVATYFPKTDGVQMMTKLQAEGLVKQGHEVLVITSKIKGFPEKEVINGVKILRVDAYNFYYWHKGNNKKYQEVVLENANKSDALVAVCLQSFSADWVLDILDKIKCKKILYLHGMPDFKLHKESFSSFLVLSKAIFRNIRWKLFYEINLNKIKKFDYITHLFYKDNSYDYFYKKGYLNNVVIENTCDSVFFEEMNKKDNKNILYVGNYCQRKNQVLALECYYKSETKDYSLTFVGSKNNAYYYKLLKRKEKLEKEYGNKNVSILYSLEREKIIELTKNCSFCFMTSNYEYYPITIIEAMASEKAFLSTNVGIINKIPGGVIVNSENDLIYWLEYFISTKLYKKLGQIGQEYANNNLRNKTQIDKLLKILK